MDGDFPNVWDLCARPLYREAAFMSNEELAVEIQNGAPERMGELWEQVAGLVKWKAKRIMTALELRGSMCGVDFDDLVCNAVIPPWWRRWTATARRAAPSPRGSCIT